MVAGRKKNLVPSKYVGLFLPSYEYVLNVHVLQGCGITDAMFIGVGTLDMTS
jgi:hypothetical protein